MLPGVEGGYTLKYSSKERMTIYEAAQYYAESGTPLVVFAGVEYGCGSSRDWAAKGPKLLGVKAVVVESPAGKAGGSLEPGQQSIVG